ncbi:MAG: hypothetical protein RTU30_05485 [Candidatus Thorarchaeota archaeon]
MNASRVLFVAALILSFVLVIGIIPVPIEAQQRDTNEYIFDVNVTLILSNGSRIEPGNEFLINTTGEWVILPCGFFTRVT